MRTLVCSMINRSETLRVLENAFADETFFQQRVRHEMVRRFQRGRDDDKDDEMSESPKMFINGGYWRELKEIISNI